jgi:hypothetical protein
MSQIFPEWTNRLPLYVAIGVIFLLTGVVGFFWYYGSPKYTDVGYRPVQPVPYSHKLHAGDLGLDCRYCHTGVEISPVAGVPPTQTCMNCHVLIKPESEKLQPVRESWASGRPLAWIRVHKVPDYAYFDHSIHISANIGCASCHGRIDQMEVVTQMEPLSMNWCLKCHRNPAPHIRPDNQVTNMQWQPPPDQLTYADRFIKEHQINPPTDCTGCHR